MTQQLVEKRDIDFVLWEQFGNEQFLNNEKYESFNKKTCDLILGEARKIALQEILPTLTEGDREGASFENGEVKVPVCFDRVIDILKKGDWGNLSVPEEMGGQGAPAFLGSAVDEYLLSANWSLVHYVNQGMGTAKLIYKYGTEEQKKTYVNKLISAEWAGTMMLTEPDAGSDIGAIQTIAKKNGDGTYSLSGTKIFITNGEYNQCQNIIHPVLARIEGSAVGTKGISIFIVPKYLVNENSSPGKRNDIQCTGIEHKHGIRASATCSMAIGSKGKCVGYLLGEVNQGMKIMFNMMNDARMETGLQALSYASAAYLMALDYAKERIQMRELGQPHTAQPVPIIKHPDVRRNLLWMKSHVEGMRSFLHYMNYKEEINQLGKTEKEQKINSKIFSLLTPVFKSYISNRGYEVCVQAMQVFGGIGYTQDCSIEQYVRDCKITSIFEGTCGIQAMDLLGKKIGMGNGEVFKALLEEIRETVTKAKSLNGLKNLADKFEEMITKLSQVSDHLILKANSPDFKTAFAHSLPFLDVIGDTIMGWMLLWRATVAREKLRTKPKKKDTLFYHGQLKSAEFFIRTIVPTSMGKMETILDGNSAAIEIDDDSFGGS